MIIWPVGLHVLNKSCLPFINEVHDDELTIEYFHQIRKKQGKNFEKQ